MPKKVTARTYVSKNNYSNPIEEFKEFPYTWHIAFDSRHKSLINDIANIIGKISPRDLGYRNSSYSNRTLLTFYFHEMDTIRPLLKITKDVRFLTDKDYDSLEDKELNIFTLQDEIKKIMTEQKKERG